jgi:hypothetical protein
VIEPSRFKHYGVMCVKVFGVNVAKLAKRQHLDRERQVAEHNFDVFESLTNFHKYLAWVKAAPTWINAPGGNALWLRDPLGQLVRDKKGNPIAVPFDKPAPAH